MKKEESDPLKEFQRTGDNTEQGKLPDLGCSWVSMLPEKEKFIP